jgi:hypothetical protein
MKTWPHVYDNSSMKIQMYDNMCDYNNYEHMATNENLTVWRM